MNFHQLRIFYAVAKLGSFTRAAHELLLTQPAVSIQIQKLEEEYKTRLFDRVGKKVILTEAGRILFGYAASILDLSKQADSALRDLRAIKTGSLNIGAGMTLGAYYVPEIISRFSNKYPEISIRMHLGNSFQITEKVLSFGYDLGFVAQVHHQERLAVLPFLRENLILIAPRNHPIARREDLTIRDIREERFILRERGSATREIVEETLRKFHVPVRVVMELGSNEAIKAAVQSGLGISIVSSRVVLKEVKMRSLVVHSFTDVRIEREFYIVYHKDKYLSSPVQAFVEETLDAFR